MRFVILKTGAVRAALRRHGEYPEMLARRLGAAAGRLGIGVDFVTFDVRRGEYPPALVVDDVLLITGSRHSVYEPLPWMPPLVAYVQAQHALRRKLIGVCFGHQLLAAALGGETRRAGVGWAVGVHEARVLARRPWMLPRLDRFALLCSHRDQVVTLPAGAERLAETALCPVAAFAIGDHVLGVQAHPEFERDYAREQLALRRELLGDALHDAGVASLSRPTDEAAIAEWMLRFALSGGAAGSRPAPGPEAK
jgi:GMP synthase-like glutamine amidotransferase